MSTLNKRVRIHAPLGTVRDALTDPAALRVWLAEHAEVDLPERYELANGTATLFLGGRADEPRSIVVVSPARELSLADHVRAGQAIAAACEGRRAAFVASADHGHAHDPEGPFGFDPAAAEYDERVVGLVSNGRLGEVLELESIVAAASADSLWQMAMLHGALGDGFRTELLSYERPTYFGMLVAALGPA